MGTQHAESNTVDREAATAESTDENHTVPREATTVATPHVLTLFYPQDTPQIYTDKFPKERMKKQAGQTFVLGRGLDVDVLLNDIHIPKRFAEVWCAVDKDTSEPKWYIKNMSPNKVVQIAAQGIKTKLRHEEQKVMEDRAELKLETLRFWSRIEEGDNQEEVSEFELEFLPMDADSSSTSSGSLPRQSSTESSGGSLTSATGLTRQRPGSGRGVSNSLHVGLPIPGPNHPVLAMQVQSQLVQHPGQVQGGFYQQGHGQVGLQPGHGDYLPFVQTSQGTGVFLPATGSSQSGPAPGCHHCLPAQHQQYPYLQQQQQQQPCLSCQQYPLPPQHLNQHGMYTHHPTTNPRPMYVMPPESGQQHYQPYTRVGGGELSSVAGGGVMYNQQLLGQAPQPGGNPVLGGGTSHPRHPGDPSIRPNVQQTVSMNSAQNTYPTGRQFTNQALAGSEWYPSNDMGGTPYASMTHQPQSFDSQYQQQQQVVSQPSLLQPLHGPLSMPGPPLQPQDYAQAAQQQTQAVAMQPQMQPPVPSHFMQSAQQQNAYQHPGPYTAQPESTAMHNPPPQRQLTQGIITTPTTHDQNPQQYYFMDKLPVAPSTEMLDSFRFKVPVQVTTPDSMLHSSSLNSGSGGWVAAAAAAIEGGAAASCIISSSQHNSPRFVTVSDSQHLPSSSSEQTRLTGTQSESFDNTGVGGPRSDSSSVLEDSSAELSTVIRFTSQNSSHSNPASAAGYPQTIPPSSVPLNPTNFPHHSAPVSITAPQNLPYGYGPQALQPNLQPQAPSSTVPDRVSSLNQPAMNGNRVNLRGHDAIGLASFSTTTYSNIVEDLQQLQTPSESDRRPQPLRRQPAEDDERQPQEHEEDGQ